MNSLEKTCLFDLLLLYVWCVCVLYVWCMCGVCSLPAFMWRTCDGWPQTMRLVWRVRYLLRHLTRLFFLMYTYVWYCVFVCVCGLSSSITLTLYSEPRAHWRVYSNWPMCHAALLALPLGLQTGLHACLGPVTVRRIWTQILTLAFLTLAWQALYWAILISLRN